MGIAAFRSHAHGSWQSKQPIIRVKLLEDSRELVARFRRSGVMAAWVKAAPRGTFLVAAPAATQANHAMYLFRQKVFPALLP